MHTLIVPVKVEIQDQISKLSASHDERTAWPAIANRASTTTLNAARGIMPAAGDRLKLRSVRMLWMPLLLWLLAAHNLLGGWNWLAAQEM